MKKLSFELRCIVDEDGQYLDDYYGDRDSVAWHALCQRMDKTEDWYNECMGYSGTIGRFKNGAYFAVECIDESAEVEKREVIDGKLVNIGILGNDTIYFTEDFEEFANFLIEKDQIDKKVLMERLAKIAKTEDIVLFELIS